jgi:hypothetical protein
MIRRRQTRFIRKILYTLKRGYGFDLTFHKKTSETKALETGDLTTATTIKRVRRAIVLPDELQHKFEYDLAFIAAAKNFTYGGLYETSLRRLIIDRQDLGDYTIELGDYFIWGERRWEVAKVAEFELQTGFMVWGKMVEGTTRYQVSEISLESALTLTQEVA